MFEGIVGKNSLGNIAIDDIEAFQIPEVCPSTVSIDVVVEDGNAFDASITSFVNISCNGLSNGELTFDVENFVEFPYELTECRFCILFVSNIREVRCDSDRGSFD